MKQKITKEIIDKTIIKNQLEKLHLNLTARIDMEEKNRWEIEVDS